MYQSKTRPGLDGGAQFENYLSSIHKAMLLPSILAVLGNGSTASAPLYGEAEPGLGAELERSGFPHSGGEAKSKGTGWRVPIKSSRPSVCDLCSPTVLHLLEFPPPYHQQATKPEPLVDILP